MINKIIDTFGTDNTIIIGDWSIGKQMSNFISTPNIALKRKLREKFKVFNIDEFRTSCLHNKTEEVCGHLYLNYYVKKTNTYYNSQYMHSILTFQMETNRTGCIDRDINGCLNMKKIFKYYLKTGERPQRYKRSYDINTFPTVLDNRKVIKRPSNGD